jgi:hypothetical protein
VIDSQSISQVWNDAGWRGALTILLGSPQLSDDSRVWRHVNLERREIHFPKILEDGTFSSGERTLVEVAASLFNDETKVNLFDALNSLDDRNANLIVTAICNFARLRGLQDPFALGRRETGKSKRNARER